MVAVQEDGPVHVANAGRVAGQDRSLGVAGGQWVARRRRRCWWGRGCRGVRTAVVYITLVVNVLQARLALEEGGPQASSHATVQAVDLGLQRPDGVLLLGVALQVVRLEVSKLGRVRALACPVVGTQVTQLLEKSRDLVRRGWRWRGLLARQTHDAVSGAVNVSDRSKWVAGRPQALGAEDSRRVLSVAENDPQPGRGLLWCSRRFVARLLNSGGCKLVVSNLLKDVAVVDGHSVKQEDSHGVCQHNPDRPRAVEKAPKPNVAGRRLRRGCGLR